MGKNFGQKKIRKKIETNFLKFFMIYLFQVRILALFFFVDILYINYFLGFFFSVCFLRRSSERILVSPTRRTSLSTLATPTEVTSLGEFQPHFGSHGQEDQKQRNNEGQRIRNNNDLLYKPFPPTSTGLIFIISLLLHSV